MKAFFNFRAKASIQFNQFFSNEQQLSILFLNNRGKEEQSTTNLKTCSQRQGSAFQPLGPDLHPRQRQLQAEEEEEEQAEVEPLFSS